MRLLRPDIRQLLNDLPIFYIPIKVSFFDNDIFDDTIKKIF